MPEGNALVFTRPTEWKQKLAAKECFQSERACGIRSDILEVSDHEEGRLLIVEGIVYG